MLSLFAQECGSGVLEISSDEGHGEDPEVRLRGQGIKVILGLSDQAEDFSMQIIEGIIQAMQGLLVSLAELLRDGEEDLLDFWQTLGAFEDLEQGKEHEMLWGVLLFDWRSQDPVLGIIVDHGLGKDAVRVLLLHEGDHLVHVQVDVWKFVGMDQGTPMAV